MSATLNFPNLNRNIEWGILTNALIKKRALDFGIMKATAVCKEICGEFARDWAKKFLLHPVVAALASESLSWKSGPSDILGFDRFLTSLIGESSPGSLAKQVLEVANHIETGTEFQKIGTLFSDKRFLIIKMVNKETIYSLTPFRPGGIPDIEMPSWYMALVAGQLKTISGSKFYLSITDVDRDYFYASGRYTRGIMVKKVPESISSVWQSPPTDLIQEALEDLGGEAELLKRINYRLVRRLRRRF